MCNIIAFVIWAGSSKSKMIFCPSPPLLICQVSNWSASSSPNMAFSQSSLCDCVCASAEYLSRHSVLLSLLGSWSWQRTLLFIITIIIIIIIMKLIGLLVLLPLVLLVEGELVKSFESCSQFFLNGVPPTLVPDQNKYRQICQKYNKKYRYATFYDINNRIPIYSAYEYKGHDAKRPQGLPWMIEPQVS